MGSRIWNKLGEEMSGSDGLLGNGPVYDGVPVGSSVEGAQIVINPANENQYYVFSGNAQEESVHKLYYSIVDMTLDGGLGAVVESDKNIEIMNNVSEYMCVAKGADCKSYWLLARDADMWVRRYYAFRIDEEGIHEPVVTVPPEVAVGLPLHTEFFNDGIRMVSMGLGSIVFSKFNGATGEVYDFESFDTAYQGPIALSPDNMKLYTLQYPANQIVQYDLSLLPDLLAVQASGTEVGTGVPEDDFYVDFRSGPDGRLYVLRREYTPGASLSHTMRIDYIDNPNASASDIVLIEDAFPASVSPFGFPYHIYHSLGSDFVKNKPIDTVFHPLSDTIVCFGSELALTGTVSEGLRYIWNTGDTTPAINVQEDGVYWLYSFKDCTYTADSFRITFIDFELNVPADTHFCTGDSFYVNVFQPGVEYYTWNDGLNNYERWVNRPGYYEVTLEEKGCTLSSGFEAGVWVPDLQMNYGDTVICNIMPIDLVASAHLPSDFMWNTGQAGPFIRPSETGMYVMTATSVCGTLSDSVFIEVIDCQCDILIPSAFSPNGDGLNDVFQVKYSNGCHPESFQMQIYNRFGQLVFSGFKVDDGWDGGSAEAYDTGTYFYEVQYRDRITGQKIYKKGDITLIR